MRRMWPIALFIALSMTLCGCQLSGEIENQAYVLVLALDRSDDGALRLTARVPQIGKSDQSGDKGGSGGSPYLSFSVSGSGWQDALDALQWATPRRVNLSHIEMIVASRALASEDSFLELMNRVMDTPHLYANARFVICDGSAREFLEAGRTVIGTRMSAEIRVMLTQYVSQGYIPEASLADFCYTANSIYGDPVAIRGYTDREQAAESPASQSNATLKILESPMKQRFSGAALFRGGVLAGVLTSDDTRLLNLIRGNTGPVLFRHMGRIIELTPDGPCERRVSMAGDAARLSLSLRLSAPDGIPEADTAALNESMKSAVAGLIRSCQRLGCDPFGFAESAAAHFATVGRWLAFDWRGRYAKAALDVDVQIVGNKRGQQNSGMRRASLNGFEGNYFFA